MTRAAEAFGAFIKNKKIAVIGAGISNSPLVKLFFDHGCSSVTVRDKKIVSDENAAYFRSLGAEVICGEDYLDDLFADIVIRTPGLRPDVPALNKTRDNGAIVIGETQLFLKFAPCRVIGVTGSDGKTTTTTLISMILKASGKKVHLGGNIGVPLLPMIDSIGEDDFACMELSSFQLMDGEYSPDISVITNLSQNHLDWHKDMNEYALAKTNIFTHQNSDGLVILNADDQYSPRFAALAPGKVEYFSVKHPVSEGAWLENGRLIYKGVPMVDSADVKIPGIFNRANYLAAICAVGDICDRNAVIDIAKTFGGVEHRCEWIRNISGVDYYNSSIDSSPARTLATLSAFDKKLTIICGGYDKHLDYDVLKAPFFDKVKKVYAAGQTAPRIIAALSDENAPYTLKRCENIKEALDLAYTEAQSGDTVILSPASASFDAFKNFEERGRYFKDLVRNL